MLSAVIEENKNLKQEIKELKSMLKQIIIMKGNNYTTNNDNSQTTNNIDNSQTTININITLVEGHKKLIRSKIPKEDVYNMGVPGNVVKTIINGYTLLYHNPNIPENHIIKRYHNKLKVYEEGKWKEKQISEETPLIINEVADLINLKCDQVDDTFRERGYEDKDSIMDLVDLFYTYPPDYESNRDEEEIDEIEEGIFYNTL